uniref:Carboxylic ester hydrolase n=1 Tax=Leptobrachium leishanense TaxID=445787 RepID=A0A8C5N022_9ANUR
YAKIRNELGSDSEVKPLVGSDQEDDTTFWRKPSDSSRTVRNYRLILAVTGGCLVLCVLVAGLAYLSGKSLCTLVDAVTECGKVRGHHCGKAYMFKGIPYASPPTGNLRWRPPQKPTCWNTTRNATEFGSVCAQVQPFGENGTVTGSEDCLFVNIWTPSLDRDAKLPVMFWIHGGFLHMLSGSEPGYSPTEELAENSPVVHVSFNYRLNAFGFMALELFREGSPTNTSGNYGFMDQLAALQWVRDNIRYFGGDPDKVTIYGQSSGNNVSPFTRFIYRYIYPGL